MIYRTEHRFLEHLLKTMNLIVPIHTNLCRLLYAHHRFSTWRPVDSCARGWCCFPWFFCGLRCYIYVGINDVDEACFCARNPPQTTFMFSELKKTMSSLQFKPPPNISSYLYTQVVPGRYFDSYIDTGTSYICSIHIYIIHTTITGTSYNTFILHKFFKKSVPYGESERFFLFIFKIPNISGLYFHYSHVCIPVSHHMYTCKNTF